MKFTPCLFRISLLTILILPNANAYRWDSENDPARFDPNFQYLLRSLPAQAQLSVTPWSETYWPSNKGSINLRWNQRYPDGFDYDSPDLYDLKRMSRAQIARLAPSEKYDIYMGRYDYPLKNEVERYANPGSMHVVLANQIGIKKQGIVAKIDPGREVWNQPVFGYEFTYWGSTEPTDGVTGVKVKATLIYTDELDYSQWLPVTGTANAQVGRLQMTYILDLDANGNIIGGTWTDRSTHPDYLWMAKNHLEFTGYLAGSNQLYHPVP